MGSNANARTHDFADAGESASRSRTERRDDAAELRSLEGVGSEGIAPLAVAGVRVGSDASNISIDGSSPVADHDRATVLTFGTQDRKFQTVRRRSIGTTRSDGLAPDDANTSSTGRGEGGGADASMNASLSPKV